MKQAYAEAAEFFRRKDQILAATQTPQPRHSATQYVHAGHADDPELES
jgi:hypothetical protein